MNAYGLWWVALLNAAFFIFFAFSFFRPRTRRDWRSFGAFSAFIVALFAEMYGFPLTIYLLSGWLQRRFPGLDPLSHEAGHLWHTLLGMKGDPHFDLLHVLSQVLIFGGFALIAAGWNAIYKAQKQRALATEGPYRFVRHPQYDGFVLIMTGFLLQWPTLLTLVMYPVLVVMYVRLARREDREVAVQFGQEYERWAAATPAFFPSLPALFGHAKARGG